MEAQRRIELDLPQSFVLPPAHVSIDEIDFSQLVDLKDFFIPEDLTYLFHTPHYAKLTADERRDYNQLSACALCEQFLFLEDYLLVPTVERLLNSPDVLCGPSLRSFLQQFIADERRHSEIYWRALETAAPQRYRRRRFSLIKIRAPWRLRFLLTRWPLRLPMWVWLSLLVDERAVFLAKRFHSSPNTSPLFRKVFESHLQEHRQHMDFDNIFVDLIHARLPLWTRQIQANIVRRIYARYLWPRVIPMATFDALITMHPRLKSWRSEVQQSFADPGTRASYRRHNFSRRALPRTWNQLSAHPEMWTVLSLLAPESGLPRLDGTLARSL